MSTINGKATRYDSKGVDYVQIFDWVSGRSVGIVTPAETGEWTYDYYYDMHVGFTYVSDGCAPITHGAYVFKSEWSLQSFINSGDPGVLYDPSDLSTLFKDTLFLFPVKDSGDKVAAMLNKNDLESIVKTTSDFSDNFDGWVGSTLQLLPDNSMRCNSRCYYSFDSIPGQYYNITINITALNFSVRLGPDWHSAHSSSTGLLSYRFIADDAVTSIGMDSASRDSWGGSDDFYEIDAISIISESNTHLTQSNPDNRPTYKTDGFLHWLAFNGYTDFLHCESTTYMSNDSFIFSAAVMNEDSWLTTVYSTSNSPSNHLALKEDTSGTATMFVGDGTSIVRDEMAQINMPSVLCATRSNNITSLFVNELQQQDTSPVVAGTISGLWLGRPDGTESYNTFNYYGGIICKYHNDHNAISKYLSYKSGVL